MSTKNTPLRACSGYKLATSLLLKKLHRHDVGMEPLSITELCTIHRTLAQDRPMLEVKLAVIGEQLEDLQQHAITEEELTIVSNYLAGYQTRLEQNALASQGTYKTGLAMQEAANED